MDPSLSVSIILNSKSWKISELKEILESKTDKLDKKTVLDIICKAQAVLTNEKIIQTFEHKSIVTIVGDTHGQFPDLLEMLNINGWPSENNPYIFNGDFVDRGKYGCEVIILILVLKLCWPKHVLLNRGNHEVMWVSSVYGFGEECRNKYDDEVYKRFVTLFNVLPLAALIENTISGKRVFVVHGGLYENHEKHGIDWINENIKKPEDTDAALLFEGEVVKDVKENEYRTLKYQIVQDLLWSDPRNKPGMHRNLHRGQGKIWGADQTKKFCDAQRIKYIVRSHETVQQGWEITHFGQVHTVFSAPNYCGCAGNLGAVMVIKGENLTPEGRKFKEYVPPPTPSLDRVVTHSVRRVQPASVRPEQEEDEN